MMKQTMVMCVLFCAFAMQAQAYTGEEDFDFSRADSVALNFPRHKARNYSSLAQGLTEPFDTDHERFRALFRWVAHNIAYDYDYNSTAPDEILKKRKGVCISYAFLLYEMCSIVGLECQVIIGHSKQNADEIGRATSGVGHAWNAVQLDGEWYLSDVTWASGSFNNQKNKWMRGFDAFFFLTPPEQFVRTHLPNDPAWQLLQTPVSASEFNENCIIYRGYEVVGITEMQPIQGELKVKQHEPLEFRVVTGSRIHHAALRDAISGGGNLVLDITYDKGDYILSGTFEQRGVYELVLYLNRHAVSAYRVTVK